jgi:hypothetical protein
MSLRIAGGWPDTWGTGGGNAMSRRDGISFRGVDAYVTLEPSRRYWLSKADASMGRLPNGRMRSGACLLSLLDSDLASLLLLIALSTLEMLMLMPPVGCLRSVAARRAFLAAFLAAFACGFCFFICNDFLGIYYGEIKNLRIVNGWSPHQT